MIIRKGKLTDLSELKTLFVNTIKNICISDYNAKQIEAWISDANSEQRWKDIITNQFVLIAQENDIIKGFCTLEDYNYIDLLYVHKDYQGKGFGSKLYYGIEKEAKRLKQSTLTSQVSKTAKPFFEKVGFMTIKEQTVIRKGIELINFRMTKRIT